MSLCLSVCVCVCVCVCVWCREDGILTLHCPISDLPSEWSPPTLTAAVYAKLASLAQEFHNKAKIERILSPFLLIYSRAVSIADISDRDYKFVLDLRGLGSYRIHSKELPLVCDFIVACRIRKRTAVVWLTDWLTGWLTDWLTNWLTDWLAGWLTDKQQFPWAPCRSSRTSPLSLPPSEDASHWTDTILLSTVVSSLLFNVLFTD